MHRFKSSLLSLLIISSFSGLIKAEDTLEAPRVKERWKIIEVTASAPIPTEVDSDTEGKALSRDAAVAIGQEALLGHILQKKTKSKKTLKDAEYPDVELQKEIRGMIYGVQVKKTTWEDGICEVLLELDKKKLKKILKEN